MSDYIAPAEPTSHIMSTSIIDMPLAQAWEKMQDFSLAHNYVEGVTKTEIVSDVKSGLGACRRVYMGDDKYNNETIIAFEPHTVLMRLHNEQHELKPFAVAQWRYTLKDAGNNKTKVIMTMSYALPWGAFGKLLCKLVLNNVMKKVVPKVASGMKHFYETGTPATDEDRTRLLSEVTTVVK
jgi:ligand-binding SRPBCC domain-containing protein